MVIGETGTGKTTLLNCYLNYLLGIEISDKFRYKLICEIPSKFRENEKCPE
jgi:ABC-type lipoprotein export system ATPase subunit